MIGRVKALLLLTLLVLVGVALFVFITFTSENTLKSEILAPKKTEYIVVGTVLPLTGKYSIEGLNALNGIQTMIEWVNVHKGGLNIGGRLYKLKLVYFDSKSSPEETTRLYRELQENYKVDFFLGPYTSKLTVAALKAVKDKIMMIHGGASDMLIRMGYKYAVQVITPASFYMKGVVDLIAEKDPNAKIALIYEESPFSLSVAGGVRSQVKYHNMYGKKIEIVYDKAYRSLEDIPKLVEEAMNSGATVLIGGGHFEDSSYLVETAWKKGWRLKALGILIAPVFPEFYDRLGEAANYVMAPTQWEPSANYNPILATKIGVEWYGPPIEEFVHMYKNLTRGEEPTYQAAEAAAAVLYLVRAIEEANSLDQKAVRDAFNKLDILTFFGRLKIDPATGMQVTHEMLIVQWQDGKKVIVYPEKVAQKEPVYPAGRWWTG